MPFWGLLINLMRGVINYDSDMYFYGPFGKGENWKEGILWVDFEI